MADRQGSYFTVRERFENKSRDAMAAAEARQKEVDALSPELKKIDRLLNATGLRLFKQAMGGKEGLEKRVDALRKENERLLKRKAELLKALGYPENYTDVRYECEKCRDTGFIGAKMCDCFRKALAREALENSGLGRLTENQSFDTFDFSYYADDKYALQNMKLVYDKCLEYAETFGEDGENLLLIGGTGLGKTHLSTSIAKKVIEKGYKVIYESAQKLISDFEKEHFRNLDTDTDRFFDCDLLIIDDLGTEMKTEFSVSCVYNVINSRLNERKPMIINTNLSQKELRERYADRITSRLFGAFSIMVFKGQDVRQKILH